MRFSVPEVLLKVTLVLATVFLVIRAQESSSSDESFLESFTGNDSSIQQLSQGEPLNGTLGISQAIPLAFTVPKRESEGLGFPDVLLSLDVTNVDGNADIYCGPLTPTSQHRVAIMWASNHTQGTDYVFISTNHTLYGAGAAAEFSKEGGIRQTVSFLCVLVGLSPTSTEFVLELDLDYTKRSLVPEEQTAVRSIFDKCCAQSGCPRWKALGQRLLGTEAEGDVPVFDLCHVADNICDDDGHLIKLSMHMFDMDCEFPLEEIKAFSRIEKIHLSHNNFNGDIGEIAAVLKDMTRLNRFRATSTGISGSVADSEVCQLVTRSLQYLDLQDNLITGPIPSCLFDMNSTLSHIYLDKNSLESTLPPNFPEDSKLQVVSLRETNLTGVLPPSMANLKRLEELQLAQNSLSGSIPADIGMSPILKLVNLSSNELTGPVPESLITSPALRVLSIERNQLTEMPGAWNTAGSAPQMLSIVEARLNNISGQLPAAIMTSNVRRLDLGNNRFEGPLPSSGELLPFAWSVVLGNNRLTGSIPEVWSNIGVLNGSAITRSSQVPTLDISDNSLSGDIPPFLVDAGNLPPQLLDGGGINLEGNNFNCVQFADNETVQHLNGVEVCEPETEGPPDEISETVAAPSEASAGSDEVRGNTEPQDIESSRVNSENQVDTANVVALNVVEEPKSSASANIAGTIIGIVAAAVGLAVIAAVVVFHLLRRRRLQAQQGGGAGLENGDVEATASKRMGFQKYTDEDAEVQMFQGQRSSKL